MLTEGCKTIGRVRALLEDILRPQDDLSALTTEVVHVTDDLAKDVKGLNFGYRNYRSYDTCHRGLSPFTVVNVSMSTMSSRSRKADQLKRQLMWRVETRSLIQSPRDILMRWNC
jgi:hypothetical protein